MLKLSIVEEEMKHTLQALANPDIYNNPEKCQEISKQAAELASDRYQLSKYHSKGQAIITDDCLSFGVVYHI